jgi:hypothetical protein
MAERTPLPIEAPYEVYLVDPGARASHVITLVQEVMQLSTPECAALVHEAPARIAGFSSREAAENLIARFREFDAVAIVRRPGDQAAPEPPPPSVVPQPRVPVAVGLVLLGVLQIGVALWWLAPAGDPEGRRVLLGVGGLVLGVLAVVAGIWKLRRDDLD